MTILQALILGVIQGFTELLPISSSAHLALTPYLFGWTDPGLAFDVARYLGFYVQAGATIAVLRAFSFITEGGGGFQVRFP